MHKYIYTCTCLYVRSKVSKEITRGKGSILSKIEITDIKVD